MVDPEKTLSDNGWTEYLVPPLAKPQKDEIKTEPSPKDADRTGLMIDVYNNQ